MLSTDLWNGEFIPLPAILAEHATERPEAIAVIDDDRPCNYREFNALVDRVAASLQQDGVLPGQCIAICARTSREYLATFLGALRAGVAVAPLAPSSTPGQLLTLLEDCAARILFVDQDTACPVDDGALRPKLVNLEGVFGGEPFAIWLSKPGNRPAAINIAPESPFNIIYSSGTTGAPKGIVQSHAMRFGFVRMLAAYDYSPTSVSLISTPLYSNTTLASVLPTLSLGGTLVLMKKFDAQRFVQLAAKHRVTHAMLVPVQYNRIMTLPDFDEYDLSSFVMKFSTSAPFSAELKAAVLERWPGGLVEFYGMTEGGGVCVLEAHRYQDKLSSVGRPVIGHDIRLIGEDGKEVRPGESGEVVGHSKAMMTGYHNQPGKSADAEWFDSTGKRFIRTGDIGKFDADGFLTLVDRKKDMIISGGFNIYPSDIEYVIVQHPDVLEAAVVGMPSKRWGEAPVAFVTPKPGRQLDAAALAAFVNGRVGKVQRPAAYEFLDALPRSGIGKVLKRELRDRKVNLG
ncbi:MAG TPA: class I adenylate-forming enzyme family protein [Steroidobacteraceae bacterium]|jgi:acyl-CoA synthetase (AMP-forming)/AMP-acid ligase II